MLTTTKTFGSERAEAKRGHLSIYASLRYLLTENIREDIELHSVARG